MNGLRALQDKCSQIWNDAIHIDTLTRAFKTAKSGNPPVYQHYNLYKRIHRRTVNNKLLYKMGMSPAD